VKATVQSVEALAHDVKRVVLKPAKPIAFSPGQYAQLQFTPDHARPYSMAGLADDGALEFHVRVVPGGRCRAMAESLRPGDAVHQRPLGCAHLRRRHTGPMLCVAGGTGLAPILAILRGAIAQGLANPVHVFRRARRATSTVSTNCPRCSGGIRRCGWRSWSLSGGHRANGAVAWSPRPSSRTSTAWPVGASLSAVRRPWSKPPPCWRAAPARPNTSTPTRSTRKRPLKETRMSDTPRSFRPRRTEGNGTHRIPFVAYTSDELYKRELERFFYKNHWCYVGLEAEVPNPGDFKRTVVGERSVIMTRDAEGSISVVENVCAHRGMRFCRERHGNRKEFVCPYHQWSYTLKGDLQGVPFRRGVKQAGQVHGGMPADFKTSEHGLTKLKVATRGGVVFASFDPDVESLEDYLGPTILGYFDRLFNGRKLKILGYNRQRIPGNWKLMQENIRTLPPGLLHTWFVTFGSGAPTTSRNCAWTRSRHAAMISTAKPGGKASR
jgi:nitrite reductase/ring-hydroxylating ferredoxin subunit